MGDTDNKTVTPDMQERSMDEPPPPEKQIRIPRPVVVAGLQFPPEVMWQWYLRLEGLPDDTPPDPSLYMNGVIAIADLVRRKSLRFTAHGEIGEPLRFVMVTQAKWFEEGYVGMPKEEIPLYPPEEGKCEKRARRLLREKWGE